MIKMLLSLALFIIRIIIVVFIACVLTMAFIIGREVMENERQKKK